jgi:hypothetical protein
VIALSPGVAQGVFELLSIVTRQQLTFADIHGSFGRLGGMPVAQVCEVAQRLGSVRADQMGLVRATDAGTAMIVEPHYPIRLRKVLLLFIDLEKPAWLQSATYGRQRVLRFVDQHLAQVFSEAGLVDGIDPEVVAFWDGLAAAARGRMNDRATEIGRQGERLTFEFETLRTGIQPKWVGVDNNADGYDLLSVIARGDPRSVSIEVKASTLGMQGSFHLTRNEWERACDVDHHLFHLWAIDERQERLLACITPTQMSAHMPINSGAGSWETVEVPFRAFEESFADPRL